MKEGYLENHRFNIKRESVDLMNEMRDWVTETKKQIPELKTVTFFGSRTVGNENNSSDLDTIVIYEENNKEKAQVLSTKIKKLIEDKFNVLKLEKKQATLINISSTVLDMYLERFKAIADESIETFTKDEQDAWRSLVSVFFLSVNSSELKGVRRYIVDSLNDKQLEYLMELLSYVEREKKTGKERHDSLPILEYPKLRSEIKNKWNL